MSRLTAQQRALLMALIQQSPTPTTILYDVRVRYDEQFPDAPQFGDTPFPNRTYKIGEPAGHALRRLEKRGLVSSERGRDCNDWSITDAGLAAMGWTR